MAKRGHTHPLPDVLKAARGTLRPHRMRYPAVPVLEGPLECPEWLEGLALELWHKKTAIYAERQQSLRGCEGAIAVYCGIEAEIIRCFQRGELPPMTLLNGYRLYASEFFDTASSQAAGPKVRDVEANPFAANGRRSSAA